MAAPPRTPSRSERKRAREEQSALLSPTVSLRRHQREREEAIASSEHGLFTPSTRYTAPAALQHAIVRWGRGNVNLHELYEDNGLSITDKKAHLPGIYVICACVDTEPGKGCRACRGPRFVFKVGLAVDLADRFDGYHTYYPHGFEIIQLFVFKQPDGSNFDMSTPAKRAAVKRALLSAEQYIHTRLRDLRPRVQPIGETRPGFGEFFETLDFQYVKNVLKTSTQWSVYYLKQWRKKHPGQAAPITPAPDRRRIFTHGLVSGVLVPYSNRNFSSVADTSARRGTDVPFVSAADAAEVTSHVDWTRETGSAVRQLRLGGGYTETEGVHHRR